MKKWIPTADTHIADIWFLAAKFKRRKWRFKGNIVHE
jgi:hypothetical protein